MLRPMTDEEKRKAEREEILTLVRSELRELRWRAEAELARIKRVERALQLLEEEAARESAKG